MRYFIPALISFVVCVVFVNVPAKWFDVGHFFSSPSFGTSFTTLAGTETLSAFPTTYNANLVLTPNLTASNGFTALNTFTNASSSKFSCYGPCYFGGSATTSISTTGIITLAGTVNGPLDARASVVGATTSIGVFYGGTGATTFANNSLLFYNGSTIAATSSAPLYLTTLTATGTSANILPYASSTNMTVTQGAWFGTAGGKVGIATTSPWALLSINPNGITGPVFAIGSSTETWLQTTNGGQTRSCETVYGKTANGAKYASSTSITLNFGNTCNQVLVQMGAAATTVTFAGGTVGDTKRIVIANPNESAGVLTFSGAVWIGGTTPVQTTTANQGDIYSCVVTQATSTAATTLKYECAANAAIQ